MLQSWIPVEKLKIKYLCQNPHPDAIALIESALEENPNIDLDWKALSANPSAIDLLTTEYITNPHQYPGRICWSSLSRNPAGMPLLFHDIHSRCRIDWSALSANPSAISVLESERTRRFQQLDYSELSRNPAGIPLLLSIQKNSRFPPIIDWTRLSSNPSPLAMELLRENPDKISWPQLLANPSAMPWIEAFPEKINWKILSVNPSAADLLSDAVRENPDKVNWEGLSRNPNAIHILWENQERINWYCLSTNPGIFQDEECWMK